MSINEIIDQLVSSIRQETELYRLMLTTIDKEKDAAIRSDLNSLNETEIEKENLLAKLHRVEEQRCLLVTKLSETLAYPYQSLTLTRISQMVVEPFAGRLEKASTDLKTTLNALREASRGNQLLFEHSLELLRGSFNLLSGLMGANKVYYRTGGIRSIAPAGKCVCSEI
ncbi:MAG: flagellar protein FlgN [Desulfobacterales bacterium]|nr:flagellar protein FlgN [Desulfobacterales bacterium]